MANFSDCWNENNKYNYSCQENCLDPCRTTNFILDSVSHFKNTRENGTKIELVMASFDYPMFLETYMWTMETFLAQFGGALGLWLGISFISILQFTCSVLLFSAKNSTIFTEYKIKMSNHVGSQKHTAIKKIKTER